MRTSDAGGGCYTCARNAEFEAGADLPVREAIAADEHWRVAHAFGAALPGWLVLLPRRHVTSVAELTDREAELLGLWQVRLSRALGAALGCEKTYVVQFAEAEGFAHVHFHVVPRAADHPEELRGPRVFQLLGKPGELTDQQMDDAAARVAAALRV